MVATILTTETPANGNEDEGTAVNLGGTFTAAADRVCIGMRCYGPTTISGTVTAGLYQSTADDNPDGTGTGTQMANATFVGFRASGYNTALWSTPQNVATGTKYRLVQHSSSGRFVRTSNAFASAGITNDGLTLLQDGTDGYDNGTYLDNAALAYPVNTFGSTNYFVDGIFLSDGDPYRLAERGSLQDRTAGTSSAVDLAAGGSVAVGNYLIARVAADNAGTNGAAVTLSVSDPAGNTWTVLGPANQDPGAASAGVSCWIAYAKVTSALSNGHDVTFDFGGTSVTAKAIVVEEWANIHATSPVAVSAVTATGASATPSVGITPGAAGQLVYAALATEGSSTDTYSQDLDTTAGIWQQLSRLGNNSGTAANDQTIVGAAKVVTGTSAQTWDPAITSRDWAAVIVVFARAAGDATVNASTIGCSAAVPAASPATGSTVTPAAVAAAATMPAAAAQAGATVSPAAVAAAVAVPAAAASGGATVTATAVAAVATIPAATLPAGATVTPDVVAGSASMPSAAVSAGATVTPATIAAGAVGRPASREATNAGLKIDPGDLVAPTLPISGMTGSDTVRNIVSPGVYENYDFPGALNILSDGVTIRNCRWQDSADFWAILSEGNTDVLIEDCEFDGPPQGIQGWGYTARRCRFINMPKDPFDVGSGSGLGDPTVIEDCLAYDFKPGPGAHSDGVQQWVSGLDTLIVRRCWFELRLADGYELPDEESGFTSPVFCQAFPETGPQGITLVEDCVLDVDAFYALRFEAGCTMRAAALRNRLRSVTTGGVELIDGGILFEGEGNVDWDLNPYNHPSQVAVQPGLPTAAGGGQIPAPAVQTGQTAAPATAAAAATLPAVTVQTGSTVAPAQVAAAASIPPPGVQTGATVTPATIVAAVAMPTPTVQAGGSATVAADPIAATASIPTPAVTASVTITPDVVACTAAVPASTVTTGSTVTPGAIGATTAIPGPTVGAAVIVTPAAITCTATVPAATVGAGSTVTPARITATVAVSATAVAAGVTVTPGVIALAVTVPASAVNATGEPVPKLAGTVTTAGLAGAASATTGLTGSARVT